MRASPGFIGGLSTGRLLGNRWRRRVIAAVLLILFALLALFPRTYRAATTMTPTDPASLGLGGALGQLGAFSSVFGNQAAVEISLKVARSADVRRLVIEKLDLVHRLHFANAVDADRWLSHAATVRALRGGILQVESKNDDPDFALKLVTVFADATRARLGEISRTQTAYKRQILTDLVEGASDRLARAQLAYDTFRRNTRYSEPGSAIGAIGARIPSLQAGIKADEVRLRSARAFATDDNMSVRQILAEIAALREQLREAESLDASVPNSVNRVVIQSTQVQKLERELGIARNLYDSYTRFLEGTSVEDLTSTGNVRILEPPYIDSARQFRTLPAALFLLVLLTELAIEFYLLRPPPGAVRDREPILP